MKQPHIGLDETVGAAYAVLPGDPARIDRVAAFLDDPRELAFSREYRSLTGFYNGVKILAMSTGMGGCSTGIAVEELVRIGVKAAVRIGSCGALQKGIGLGDLIIAEAAVRDDGASLAYVDSRYPAVADFDLLSALKKAAEQNGFPHHVGIVHSHESFYIDDNAEQEAGWAKRGVLGSDMETAALLTIGRLRGLKAASVLNNVVATGESTAESIGGYASGESLTATGEKREIKTALNALTSL